MEFPVNISLKRVDKRSYKAWVENEFSLQRAMQQ